MKVLCANRPIVPDFARLRTVVSSTTFKNLALVAFITGIAFFVLAPWMGLYEDDYAYVAQPAVWNLGELIKHIQGALTTMPQGRPIGWILPQVISYIGWRLGGLPVLYFAAYLVTMLNACLFYFLLKRFGGETFALFGTFGLVLFPADTTRPFLMHAFGLQTSLTFLLLASHFYFTPRRALSYLLAAASLLTYESAFLPFLFVPLLELPWDRARLGTLVRHLALCALMIVAVLALRRVLGESRVSASLSDPFQVLFQSVAGMVIGPLVSLSTFGYRFLAPLQSDSRIVWAGSLIAAVVLIWRFSRGGWLSRRRGVQSAVERAGGPAEGYSERGVDTLPPVQYLIVGGLMLVFAYAFAFTHFPPTLTGGRLTSVHLAAAVGAGILFGWLSAALLYIARRRGVEWLAATVLALYLAGLVGFGLVIQNAFRFAWLHERLVWTQIVEKAGDANFDDVILIENLFGVWTPFIYPYPDWIAPGMLGKLYGRDRNNRPLPRLYFAPEDWKDYLTDEGEWLRLDRPGLDYFAPIRTELRPNKFIVLRYQDGELLRLDTGLEVSGKVLNPKPRTTDVLSDRPRRRIFNVLIDPTLE